MVRFLKEICRFVYWELTEPAAALEPLRKELKQVMEPLKGREDFEEPEEICLEVSCCGQEFGFISGFKYGIAFMIECMEWPGRE